MVLFKHYKLDYVILIFLYVLILLLLYYYIYIFSFIVGKIIINNKKEKNSSNYRDGKRWKNSSGFCDGFVFEKYYRVL